MMSEKRYLTEKSYKIFIEQQYIHYRVMGHGSPLILIHGFGVSGHIWEWILPYLAQEYQVFVVDLPGYGQSTFRPPWRLRAMAPLLIAWLRKMELSSVVLMGQSMGGGIAIQMSALAPELVEQLVLVSAAGLPLNARLPQLMVRSVHSILQTGNGSYPPALLYDVLRPRPLLFWQTTQEMMHNDFRAEMASITLPTLIIWGERDALLPLSMGLALQAALPHARFITLSGCGHRPMLAQPELLSKIILDFLRTQVHQGE